MSADDREDPNGDMPFASVEYFNAWIGAFGGPEAGIWGSPDRSGKPTIAYVRAPMSLGPFRIAATRGATNDHTARYDSLSYLSQPAAVFSGLWRARRCSVLQFDYLSHEGNLLRSVRDNHVGLWYQVDICETSWQVDCQMPWEDYWTTRGSTRHLWTRREHKLSKLGATFRCLDDWRQIEPLLPIVFAVEASGWKGREGSAIGQNPQTKAFYERCLRYWASRGWLRLFLLELNGEILAFQVTVLHAGVLYQLKVGYEERHAKLSPGQVLQLFLLRSVFADPNIQVYDMLGGGGKAESNKIKWATGGETLYTLRLFRKNIGGWLAWLRFVIAPRIKAILYSRRSASQKTDGTREDRHSGVPGDGA